MSTHKLEIYFDGASKGNPGPSGAGWMIQVDGQLLRLGKLFLGKKTNNQAEYMALLKALEEALAWKHERAKDDIVTVIIKGDSELIIRQLKGEYKVRNKTLKPLFDKIMNLLTCFDRWECHWIPREENSQADSLANEAISEATVD